VYGSSKAMITAFTSGLRQRLHKSNVTVTTIKPGLIDSPMTVDFNKNILWVMPTYAAKKIVKGIDVGKYFIYVPGFWRLIMIVFKLIPEVIFVRIFSLTSGRKNSV
jgi:short-subunit dehydrogenase